MQKILSHIEAFGAEEFIAIMIKKIDSGQNLQEFLCINRKGINNGTFIHQACLELEKFLHNLCQLLIKASRTIQKNNFNFKKYKSYKHRVPLSNDLEHLQRN